MLRQSGQEQSDAPFSRDQPGIERHGFSPQQIEQSNHQFVEVQNQPRLHGPGRIRGEEQRNFFKTHADFRIGSPNGLLIMAEQGGQPPQIGGR